MFIIPHGTHRAMQHLQSNFYWVCVWRVAQEWAGWEWKRLRSITVGLCLALTPTFSCGSPLCLLSPQLSLPVMWIKTALRFCQSKSACVWTWPHGRPTSASGVGLVYGCRRFMVRAGGRECALNPQGSPPWPLCNSFCSQSSLAYTCDIMIVSIATNYGDINAPSTILLHCIEERWKVMNNRLGLGGKK